MARKRYAELEKHREIFLERAREASKLTLPMVIRDKHADAYTNYETPYQSVGARGVLNLASNLLLSLFPDQTPFFRLLVSEAEFQEFGDKAAQVKKEVDETLQKIERTVLEELETFNMRPSIFDALQNLLIGGNSLVYVEPEGSIRTYTMEDYVIARDVSGNVIDIIIKESIHKEVVESMGIELPAEAESDYSEKECEIFTCIHRESEQWYVYQEVSGQVIESTKEYYPLDKLPWIALRLTKVSGESWGRGYVASCLGDLKSLEALQKSLVESAAIAAKTLFLVNPASTTRAKVLAEARNGAVINGNASDVTTLQVQKAGDLSTAFEASRILERRLSYNFSLLDASLPTKGMTTATEVNAIISSLEKVLAGTYSMLANEFMRPLVSLIIDRLSEMGKIPQLPGSVKLIISTGISILGRSSDLQRLQEFVAMAAQVAPEAYAGLVDQRALLKAMVNSIGVDSSIMKSDEQLAMEQQQALAQQQAQMQMAQQQMAQEQQSRIIEKVAPQVVAQNNQQN